MERVIPVVMNPNTTTKLAVAGLAAGALLFVPACSDEDGDGGTTDEEIQDLEDEGEEIGDDIDDEVDAQNEGSNEDGE